jgi:hypothetical protein
MSDWADEMVAKIRRQTEGVVTEDAKEIEIQNRIEKDGPLVWNAVKSDINFQGQALNTKLGKELVSREVSTENDLVLLADFGGGLRQLTLNFYPLTGSLIWIKASGRTGAFQLNISGRGPLAFFYGGAEISTGDIARRMLEVLLR